MIAYKVVIAACVVFAAWVILEVYFPQAIKGLADIGQQFLRKVRD